jgi:hypothetical protein
MDDGDIGALLVPPHLNRPGQWEFLAFDGVSQSNEFCLRI